MGYCISFFQILIRQEDLPLVREAVDFTEDEVIRTEEDWGEYYFYSPSCNDFDALLEKLAEHKKPFIINAGTEYGHYQFAGFEGEAEERPSTDDGRHYALVNELGCIEDEDLKDVRSYLALRLKARRAIKGR